MRHRKKGRKLNITSGHRKALFSNQAVALFRNESIQTTLAKTKELRSVAEKLITLAKRGDLHARRQAARTIRDHEVLQKLFDEIGPRYIDINGGYTRIVKVGPRLGDAAPMAYIELI